MYVGYLEWIWYIHIVNKPFLLSRLSRVFSLNVSKYKYVSSWWIVSTTRQTKLFLRNLCIHYSSCSKYQWRPYSHGDQYSFTFGWCLEPSLCLYTLCILYEIEFSNQSDYNNCFYFIDCQLIVYLGRMVYLSNRIYL